jgi:hypothetical protein
MPCKFDATTGTKEYIASSITKGTPSNLDGIIKA